jgi:hypothetical protein
VDKLLLECSISSRRRFLQTIVTRVDANDEIF